jgi:TolB-like protein
MAMLIAGDIGSATEITGTQVQSLGQELELIFSSKAFAASLRCQEFLSLVVKHALAGNIDNLRERMIGVQMFGRRVDYDTSNDAVVRVRATEVRKRLGLYYAELGKPPAVRIELPVGSYVPKFYWEQPERSLEVHSGPESATAREGAALQEPAGRHVQIPTNQSGRKARLIAGVVACLMVLAVIGYFTIRRLFPSYSGIQSIVVLPLENLSGDPKQDSFADVMTEELTVDLGQVSKLRVISGTSRVNYKDRKKSMHEIAQELKVDAVVEGSVACEGNEARITAQLIDARGDRHIWARTYTRDRGSVLALEREVAREIADAAGIELRPQ